jgi:hypothetical protein
MLTRPTIPEINNLSVFQGAPVVFCRSLSEKSLVKLDKKRRNRPMVEQLTLNY